MKSIERIITDRKKSIELNNMKILEYPYTKARCDNIKCICLKCGYTINDNYINLSCKKYKCKYCILIEKSELVKSGIVSIIKIDGHGNGSSIYLRCNEGHEYKQDRSNLLANKGCNKCYLKNKVFKIDDIIDKFNKIHGDYYKYNISGYKNLHSIVEITCKKGHIFNQKVSNHLQGKGCPICRESLGERTISKYLNDNNFIYERQKKFKDCKYISYLLFDFYIQSLNLLIEYDGIQHIKPITQFGGEDEFEKTKIKDNIKNKYCFNNNINLLRISYNDDIQEKLNSINKYIVL